MAAAIVTATIVVTPVVNNIEWLANGDYALTFVMVDAVGNVRKTHRYVIKADGSTVSDEAGVVLGGPVTAFATTLATVKTHADTALAAAAAAGKITI